MSGADGTRPEPGPDADKGEIEADIEKTREALGETTAALATKLDVPQQARQKVDETKQRVAAKTEPLRANAVPITVALAVTIVGLYIWRRRRR